MNDKDIIGLYFDRSEDAITETDKKYGKYCRRMAFNILGSREDSDECVNDTYLRLWELIPPEDPPSLGGFIAKVTRHIAMNRRDRGLAAKRGGGYMNVPFEEIAECLPSPDTVENAAETGEFVAAVEKFLLTQSSEKQSIFMRRYWSMEDVGDIAKELHISETKVKVTLHRLREKLRKYLEKEGLGI